VVVISAMGKTTNELENVVNLYYASKPEWEVALQAIFDQTLGELFNDLYEGLDSQKADGGLEGHHRQCR
jgi:aspartokinase